MHISIVPVIEQMFVSRKIVPLGMFQNQYPVRFQDVAPQNQIWYFIDFQQFVRRVGKNYVVAMLANGEEMEDVAADNAQLAKAHFTCCSADERNVSRLYFNGMNQQTSTRSKLVGDTSGTRKQV